MSYLGLYVCLCWTTRIAHSYEGTISCHMQQLHPIAECRALEILFLIDSFAYGPHRVGVTCKLWKIQIECKKKRFFLLPWLLLISFFTLFNSILFRFHFFCVVFYCWAHNTRHTCYIWICLKDDDKRRRYLSFCAVYSVQYLGFTSHFGF